MPQKTKKPDTTGKGQARRSVVASVRSDNDTDLASEKAEEESKPEAIIKIIYPESSVPPPWPEWSDQYINDKSWKGDPNNPFEDSLLPTRMLSITHNYTLVRPAEYGPTPPAVVKLNSSVLDLITPNAHLCEKSELIRYILSEISQLYEYSLQNKTADCEGEGVAYIPNYGEDKRWTPWSHIYSCCKAGVREKPAYNPCGLYYVRLYFMGSWRRIAVDDRIPVLSSEHHGLPLTDTKELWPMLLTKALLKIASVTWNDFDGKRFSVISALTGWVFEWVDSVEGVNEEELWIDLTNTLPKYSDPKRIPSCYTLLKPSKKKMIPEEGNDTWWMPSFRPSSKTSEDLTTFTNDDLEPLEQTGDELTYLDIQWSRQSRAKKNSVVSTGFYTTTADSIPADYGKEVPTTPMPTPATEEKGATKKLNANITNNLNKKGKKAAIQMQPPKNKKIEKPKKRDAEKSDKVPGEPPATPKQGEQLSSPSEILQRSPSVYHWKTVKGLVFNRITGRLNPRNSRSKSRMYLEKDTQDLAEVDPKIEEYRDAVQAKTDSGLPSMIEILYGVQKIFEIDNRSKIRNWENICGKDSPIALVVVLKVFPRPDNSTGVDTPAVPSFLQHPIQLTEIRDTDLQPVDSDRPRTPLWKRFRWKAWAMKKGLIPLEEHSEKARKIHAVKAKTPFVFKTDWYKDMSDDDNTKIVLPMEWDGEGVEEYDGEGAEYGNYNHFVLNAQDSNEEMLPPLTQNELFNANGDWSKPHKSHGSEASAKHKESVNTDKRSRLSNADKRNSQGEDKSLLHYQASETLVLYETEHAEGDSDEEVFDESSKIPAAPASPPASPDPASDTENPAPNAACATVWLTCADVAKNLRKFCKFYKSQSMFGSCYILRREPTLSKPMLDPIFQEISSNLPQYPSLIEEFKQQHDGLSYSIHFDRLKSYSVTDYHLNEKEGIDSGFYLFSDSWTEQELIITVDLLQDDLLRNYLDTTVLPAETLPAVPPPTANFGVGFTGIGSFSQASRGSRSGRSGSEPYIIPPSPSTLHFIVEPWSWRKDNYRSEPLISTTVDEYWITHLRLPPGRNTFRIWLLMQTESDTFDGAAEIAGEDGEGIPHRRTFVSVPFSVRIVSQTPIYLGSRIEVQNYMTNFPTLLLKQAERLANSIWGVFACFGRKQHIYQQSLDQLRRAYCPKAPEPKMIIKHARGVHATFQNLFINLLTHLNGGVLDRILILTLQILFLDPTIGDDFMPMHKPWRRNPVDFTKSKIAVLKATITIQKYYRGWRTRRLFQMRQKGHRDYKKIEFNVRRIAYLLAKNTDSVFSRSSQTGETQPDFDADLGTAPLVTPTILPEPPYWALDFIKYILEAHPWLVNIYPHVHCASSHIKIQEFQGELPELKEFSKCPFFKIILIVPRHSKHCFCEIDLQVYPTTGMYLQIQNNDTKEYLSLVNNRLFTGYLYENEHGYTIQCYRWAILGIQDDFTERVPSNAWKIRVISAKSQVGPIFQKVSKNQRPSLIDETDEESGEEDDENEVCFDRVVGHKYSREERGEGSEEDEDEDEAENEEEEEEMQSEEESTVPELKAP